MDARKGESLSVMPHNSKQLPGLQAPYPGYPGYGPDKPGQRPLSPAARRAQLRVMSNDDQPNAVLIDRIDKRLAAVDLSAHEASRRASNSASGDLIRDIRRSKTRAVRMATLISLAEVLECDPEYLTGQQDRPRKHHDVPEANAPRASFALSDAEIQLIGLLRSAPEEQERILSVVRTLVVESLRVDQRGRKAS